MQTMTNEELALRGVFGDPSVYDSEEEYLDCIGDFIYYTDLYETKSGEWCVELCQGWGYPWSFTRLYFNCVSPRDIWTNTLTRVKHTETDLDPVVWDSRETIIAEEIYTHFEAFIDGAVEKYLEQNPDRPVHAA